MINAEFYTWDGRTLKADRLLSYRLDWTMGVPCDSYRIRMEFQPELLEILPELYRFKAFLEGETVFYGVVDEYSAVQDAEGSYVDIWGRSLAALLMDDQVRAVQYGTAGLEDILKNYVNKAEIERIEKDPMSSIYGFTVDSGASRWQVLCDFCLYSAGVQPRFLRDGTLYLKKESGGKRVKLQDEGLLSMEVSGCRYGVVSQVTVVNRVMGSVQTVRDEDFIQRGGSAQRVINVTGDTGYKAMLYTGQYTIDKSKRLANRVAVTLSGQADIQPGDSALLEGGSFSLSGSFLVNAAAWIMDEQGLSTQLELLPQEDE